MTINSTAPIVLAFYLAMPIFIEAAKARVTLGEICGVLRKCWGVHNPMQAY